MYTFLSTVKEVWPTLNETIQKRFLCKMLEPSVFYEICCDKYANSILQVNIS